VIGMDITIHTTFLPHTDPEASLAFYRDLLGFELTQDVGQGAMRWLTLVAPAQPDVRLVLTPPAVDPGITDDERRTIVELMAKGSYQSIILATKDLDGVFEKLQAADAEVVSEPTEQPWGVRDCAFRDPAGNMVRIDQVG
jgi:catechol 2,3-dioxygenase-like lactoylglutathione lyase family enzyme